MSWGWQSGDTIFSESCRVYVSGPKSTSVTDDFVSNTCRYWKGRSRTTPGCAAPLREEDGEEAEDGEEDAELRDII